MPNARPSVLSFVCNWLSGKNTEDIKSVLDIGCGFGKWGFLSRLYIQAWKHDITKEEYRNWRMFLRVDAIEIFGDYITDLQRLIYNNIYIGDAREMISGMKNYDLIIMGDVLEHLEHEDGFNLLVEAKKKSKWLLITMPDYFCIGDPIMGNEAEIHKHVWEDSEFPGNPQIRHLGNQKVILYANF